MTAFLTKTKFMQFSNQQQTDDKPTDWNENRFKNFKLDSIIENQVLTINSSNISNQLNKLSSLNSQKTSIQLKKPDDIDTSFLLASTTLTPTNSNTNLSLNQHDESTVQHQNLVLTRNRSKKSTEKQQSSSKQAIQSSSTATTPKKTICNFFVVPIISF